MEKLIHPISIAQCKFTQKNKNERPWGAPDQISSSNDNYAEKGKKGRLAAAKEIRKTSLTLNVKTKNIEP